MSFSDESRETPKRQHCTQCCKVVFDSQPEARTFVNAMRQRRKYKGKTRHATRARSVLDQAYECPHGNGWHVARSPRRDGYK